MKKLIYISLLAIFLQSCSQPVMKGNYLALDKNDSYQNLTDMKIEGESCKQYVFFIPFGENTVSAAFHDALSKAPEGTTGLSEVEVEISVPLIGGFLAGRYCMTVRGYPAKSPYSPDITHFSQNEL